MTIPTFRTRFMFIRTLDQFFRFSRAQQVPIDPIFSPFRALSVALEVHFSLTNEK